MPLSKNKLAKKRAIKKSKRVKRNKINSQHEQVGGEGGLYCMKPIKMSEIILDLCGEPLHTTDDIEEKEDLIRIAILAWNISLLPENVQQDTIISTYKQLNMVDQQTRDEFLETIQFIITRKRMHYAHIIRPINDYNLQAIDGKLTLNVMSTIRSNQ